MKKVLAVVAVAGVAMAGTNYYYTYQIEKHLSSAAGMMRSMGGYLEYSDVSVTFGGDVEIDRVRFMVPGQAENISLDRIALRTDGIFGIHKLAADIRKKRLPEKMALALEGITVPVGGDAYRQMNTLASEMNENLLAAGCGERELFSDADIAAMGFGELAKVDSTTEYRLMNDGQWFELESKTIVQGMNELTIKTDFSLDAASRDLTALGAAAANIRFNELIVDYKDTGYVRSILDFCAKEAGLSEKEFLAHHLAAWQETLAEFGFAPGNNLIAGYANFLESPDHFRLTIKPADDFDFSKLANIEPEMLPYQFRTRLAVNGNDMGVLELLPITKPTQVTPTASIAPPKPTNTSDPRRRENRPPTKVAIEDLRNYLNAEVTLHLTNGRHIEGRIIELGADQLQVHSYQPTGHMTIPVNFSQISEAYVK
jgi:hypothetical protein